IISAASESGKLRRLAVPYFIMYGRASRSGGTDARADFDRFNRLERHYSSRQQRVEALVPLGICAQTWRHAVGDDFKNTTHGVPGLEHAINFFLHTLLGALIGAVEQNFLTFPQGCDPLPGSFRVPDRRIAQGDYVAQHFDSELPRQQLCYASN